MQEFLKVSLSEFFEVFQIPSGVSEKLSKETRGELPKQMFQTFLDEFLNKSKGNIRKDISEGIVRRILEEIS